MNLRAIFLLGFTAASALGQQASPNKELPNDPKAFVQSLYTRVVARHPEGIPEGAEWNVFAPYFSQNLLHGFNLAKACSADWDRSNSDLQLKGDMASAFGIFTGERGPLDPKYFQILKALQSKDGSLRVYVELTQPSAKYPYSWRVMVRLAREDGHLAVDDVIYINNSDYRGTGETKPPDRRLSGYLAAGCNGTHWITHSLPSQPEALVRGLYQQVIDRKPLNIPWGEDWKAFAPYFGSTLMHRFDVYRACMQDWDKQNPNTTDKPPGLIEYDIFSGSSEEADPVSFRVENTETEKDGAVSVYVRLRWQEGKNIEVWRVADVLIRESGRLVLNDVIFLKDPKRSDDVDTPLSKLLAEGCDGSHWVGYRDH